MQDTEALEEARREMRNLQCLPLLRGLLRGLSGDGAAGEFSDADLEYLANLCHDCRGCYYACQYAPPHEFGVNLPQTFAQIRAETYEDYAWPRPLARLFRRNGSFSR